MASPGSRNLLLLVVGLSALTYWALVNGDKGGAGGRSDKNAGPDRARAATSIATASPESAIRGAFEGYRSALLSRNGPAAAGLVTEGTLAYYGYILSTAIYSEQQELIALPSEDRLMVSLVQSRLKKEVLETMSGRDLFSHAVTAGWIDSRLVRKMSVDSVLVQGTRALVDFSVDERHVGAYDLYLEKGKWKVDLMSMLYEVGQVLDSLSAQ